MEQVGLRTAPLHVLVIDDDQNDAMLLELACSMGNVNARLHFVPDGQHAIAYLEGKPPYKVRLVHPWPDLILLDLKVPKISGFHVLEWLRDHPRERRIPVAVLTGSDASAPMALGCALGADAFIIGPCDFSRLTSIMHSLCNYCLKMRSHPRRSHPPRLGARDFAPNRDLDDEASSKTFGPRVD